MKKIYFRFRALKPFISVLGVEKSQIVIGRVEALDLNKRKEEFAKRGFTNFQYWIDEKEEDECQRTH